MKGSISCSSCGCDCRIHASLHEKSQRPRIAEEGGQSRSVIYGIGRSERVKHGFPHSTRSDVLERGLKEGRWKRTNPIEKGKGD